MKIDEENLKKLKEKTRNEELFPIYGQVLGILLLSIICAIIGYFFYKELEYNPIKGIIMGIACPWGYIVVDHISKFLDDKLEDLYKLLSIITFGIYAILWFIIKIYISAYIGLIAGPIMIIYYIIQIEKTWKKDYTQEAKSRYNLEYREQKSTTNDKLVEHNEKYYCEMCFKRISQNEYELYDFMCEDCFFDVHTDENGKFDENYFKY